MASRGGRGGRGGGRHASNPYRRALSGGSAWAKSSQGARANAVVRSGRSMNEAKQYALRMGDALDKKFGFPLLPELMEEAAAAEESGELGVGEGNAPRLGWLLNMRACTLPDVAEGKHEVSAVELYFLEQDGKAFKTRVIYQPYFYVRAEENRSQEVIAYCMRRFEGLVAKAERVLREDLDMPNHLNGKKAVYVKLSFFTVSDLVTVKQALGPIVDKNQAQQRARQAYELQSGGDSGNGSMNHGGAADDEFGAGLGGGASGGDENESALIELREYDVPYPMRVAIDLDIRVGAWYNVGYDPTAPYSPSDITRLRDMVDKAEPVVCAFDIETTKAPLKFPDAQFDQIYMISYMVDRQGYLIVNREFVSEDISDFEYTPKEDYPGPFIVFNEANEEDLLRRFLDHLVDIQPHIYVTYNGDFFDWPFIDARCKFHGINLAQEIGVSLDLRSGEYRGRSSVHLDAFCWVKRDSYLPQGSQGLKAVTKYKLGYDPVEVDAEDMVPLARDDPHRMASYSVSDAVATFYLYDKYVHLFVFSLCTIIPLNSEDVLRKGSGTLCEALLMVEAFTNSIICPNKSTSGPENNDLFHQGHLVENETYVGGHVECLESGVFRADFLYEFNLVPTAFEQLQDCLDRDLRFAIEVEMELSMDEIANYDEVKREIWEKLQALKEKPHRREKPLIYHLDVAAMYPNIILTNRLQPCAIVNEAACAACVYNTECGQSALKRKQKTDEEIESSSCQRVMDWVWRGDYYPASRAEYMAIKTQLEYENFPAYGGNNQPQEGDNPNAMVPFRDLKPDRQRQLAKTRLKHYCSSVYKKLKITSEEKRSATICMRENPFYVDTVRAFRDRRYEYKTLTKVWKGKQSQAEKNNDLLGKIEAQTKSLVYDSLQLAHKCILNSFYGYVMRRGARWHSMEMAGIVTHTGSNIITNARKLVEQIGRPLELDTDGIWAILPASFPENFSFMLKDGKTKKRISYPCVMLNAQVQNEFNNPQYHELDEATGQYKVKKECSILFEVDGPYKAMVLPASTEEGRLLKKRYAVFNFDHSLAELKGFELKRRGELQLIKAFQAQVFECFLDGSTLEECYASVAACANRWLDVIDTRGRNMHDDELLSLLTENKSMSGKLDEYEGQKSTSITTARRLGEFLGAEMVKDKGLTCRMIIASKPAGEKVTERAIPTAIFAAEEAVKRHFLKKWLKDPNLQDFDIRGILDWEYYRGRYAATVQKIISLPAAFQNVRNPVPRIELPDWMRKQVREKNAKHQQGSLTGFIQRKSKLDGDYVAELIDMEDLAGRSAGVKRPSTKKGKKKALNGSFTESASSTSDQDEDAAMESAADDSASDVPVKLGEVDFKVWLKNRKSKWKSLLLRRKRQREELTRSMTSGPAAKRMRTNAMAVNGGIGMENFVMMNTTSSLSREAWQIVEIQPDHAGLFTCWVVTGDSQLLHRITVKIPRVLYIELTSHMQEGKMSTLEAELPANVARRGVRVIPHGSSSKPQQVLEIMLSEQQYQEHQKELSQILSDPLNVAGVYELQVAALTRAVCALGCVVRVVRQPDSTSSSGGAEYELTDLQFQSTATVPYLHLSSELGQSSVSNIPQAIYMRRVLLFFAQQNRRAILALVILRDESSASDYEGDARVWFVDPFSPVKPRRSEMEQIFGQLQQDAAEAGVSVTMSRCNFKEIQVVKTAGDAFNAASTALSRFSSDKQVDQQTPTIVIAQSSISSSKRLREKISGLHNFPLTMLPWHEEDSLFPALTWRPVLAERMLTRLMEMGPHFQDVLECARYAHVPVGNFSGDHALSILDTLYSRMLTKNKHLWWHSSTSLPDLGGREQELAQQQAMGHSSLLAKSHHDAKQNANTAAAAKLVGGLSDAVVCAKGSYVDICVELELDGLAVNALLVASHIDSIEGISNHQVSLDFDDGNGGSSGHEESDRCEEAFRLLRSMVTNLFKDFLASRNKFADHLLQQFYRWLCSPHALSYDPALQARVKQLMEKVFLQLLAEFRRLGAQIVYADFSKIILCTKKSDLENAQTYVSFIIQTVLGKELFQILSMTPKKYLEHLFFLDAENYGGVLLKTVNADQDAMETDEHEETDEEKLEIISHWNVANFLPRGIDDYFLLLVGQFIRRRAEFQRRKALKPHQALEEEDADQAQLAEEDQEKALTPIAKYSQRLVSSYFSDKLLRIVPEIVTYNMGPESFPVHAGSHLPLESPALELVKFVSAVFQLEPTVDGPVQKMKRTLLKLLQVSEFSDEAVFRNPSLSFLVPDVICQSCNLCRSVDLCRDPQLFKMIASEEDANRPNEEGEADGEASAASWHCPRCFALYDKAALEARLVEMVHSQSVQYQLQDVYCRKCQLPAEHKMRDYCTCSGTYGLQEGARTRIQEMLRLLHRVAEQHNFEWLLETVQRLEFGTV
ncbi:hypothetical protein Poli38472_010901 [Pythium oligandrum]|uniref:DNA polymerase epsilon catalytic subunit n=1 Tax=Pythium oligandrum TaxID=41045 RepID=A0A8K1CFZ5_PYTOL|nr:hypothetical protein Poli38472_010901 [Pythium oligandrum]|eukprot:TMW61838.1 hypothetical protein Poli38472_010901 [Pythium oligandrum]